MLTYGAVDGFRGDNDVRRVNATGAIGAYCLARSVGVRARNCGLAGGLSSRCECRPI